MIDELLSLKFEEILALLKDWNLFNAKMMSINDKLNLQSEEFFMRLHTETESNENEISTENQRINEQQRYLMAFQ